MSRALRRPPPTGVVVLWLAIIASARATTVTVHPGDSIQTKIDAASAGSTIVVEPGVYREPGATRAITITKSGIRLLGRSRPGHPVVLEQSGTQTQGIWVSPADTLDPADVELPPCGVSNHRLTRFELRGFTVQGFTGFGVYLACVDGFTIRSTTARDDLTYAIFPVRSSRGRMTRNLASGTRTDACLYVGQDQRIRVDHNRATDCLIGLQIENSQHIRMDRNVAVGNTAGMIVDVLNGRQVKTVADNRVVHNIFRDNNRPNTAPPDEDTSNIPPGIGLVLQGADRTLFADNVIEGNTFAGMTFVGFCLANAEACGGPLDIDPNPDGNRIVHNVFLQNHTDVIYLPGRGQGNCFARNRPAVLTGGPLPACR